MARVMEGGPLCRARGDVLFPRGEVDVLERDRAAGPVVLVVLGRPEPPAVRRLSERD